MKRLGGHSFVLARDHTPLQIELIGCTGAGKTTIARKIASAGRRLGIEVLLDDDFILRQFFLNWVRSPRLRQCLVNLLALVAFCVHWRSNRHFTRFSLGQITHLPVGWVQKLYLLRIVMKKIGAYDIIRRCGSPEEIVLVDEGTTVIANNLFVHCHIPLDCQELAQFAEIVPLPDVALYVREREQVLVHRTALRGHKRIRSGSQASVETFIERAVKTFDVVTQHPNVRPRVLVVETERQLVFPQYDPPTAEIRRAWTIVRAGMSSSATSA
jgi:hypothetical protein